MKYADWLANRTAISDRIDYWGPHLATIWTQVFAYFEALPKDPVTDLHPFKCKFVETEGYYLTLITVTPEPRLIAGGEVLTIGLPINRKDLEVTPPKGRIVSSVTGVETGTSKVILHFGTGPEAARTGHDLKDVLDEYVTSTLH